MRKDELMIGCVVLLVIIVFGGILHVDNPRSFGLDADTAKFLRGILAEYFTRIAGVGPMHEEL